MALEEPTCYNQIRSEFSTIATVVGAGRHALGGAKAGKPETIRTRVNLNQVSVTPNWKELRMPSENATINHISVDKIKDAIRDIPDFPKPGILFKDITPVLKDPVLFNNVIDYFYQQLREKRVQYVVGIESRGFILGAALAYKLGAGFVPVRKKGKLPGLVEQHEYDLEYGSDTIEIHADAIEPGARVVLIDDLLATGGTAAASITLLEKLQADVIGIMFMIELGFLNGRDRLPALIPTHAMMQF